MLINDSYKNHEVTNEMNSLVGKPFGLMTRFRMGGIGSPRLEVTDASEDILEFMPNLEAGVSINIELRQRGIIIRFRYYLDIMAWIIPYSKMRMLQTGDFEISDDASFLRFKRRNHGADPSKFFAKMEMLSSENQNSH